MDDVDTYIKKYPQATQAKLQQLRAIIKAEVPQATEELKWGNPGYSYDTILFIFAGYKHHIGLHVTKSVIAKLENYLKDYKTTAGSVQFQLDKPLPVAVVTKVLQSRIKEYEDNGVLWK